MQRIESVRSLLNDYEVDAIVLYGGTNVRYVSGYTADAAQTLITQTGAFFFTDGRFAEQAQLDVTGFDIRITGFETRADEIAAAIPGNVAVLGIDMADITGTQLMELEAAVAQHVEFVDISTMVAQLRMIKSTQELALMQKAADFSDQAFSHLIKYMKAGVSEVDIKAELAYFAVKQGTDFSFPPIVVSGPRSSLPHGEPTHRKLQSGDFVTIDMGFVYEGYCSDFTRTVCVGRGKRKTAYCL